MILKKLSVSFFLFVLYLRVTNCQSFDIPNLGVKDIEMGFVDSDPLRILLIEQGFILMQEEHKEEKEELSVNNLYYPEWWRYGNNDIAISIYIAVNETPKSKVISISIHKTFQDYHKYLISDIKKYFPDKKLLPGHELKNGDFVEKGFNILYFRKDSKVEIEYSENDEVYDFNFYWNYNIRDS
jgi:hypothetical protein